MLKRLRRWAARATVLGARVASQWRELAVGIAFVAGWVFITRGVAELVPDGPVWSFSIGLFLWALGGLGTLKDIALEGLYVLWRAGGGGRGE